MRMQMVEPLFRFLQRRDVTGLDPPHRNRRPCGCLEEFVFAGVDVAMHRLEYELRQRFRRFPDGEIHIHRRVARPAQRHGTLAGRVLEPPHETRHSLGECVDAREIGVEIRHARIVGAAENAANIHLGEMTHARKGNTKQDSHGKRRAARIAARPAVHPLNSTLTVILPRRLSISLVCRGGQMKRMRLWELRFLEMGQSLER